MDDDEPTGFRFYRIAYDHDRDGWCVWEQTKDNRLVFNCGPFGTELEASKMMRDMNVAQGMNWYEVKASDKQDP